MLCWDQDLLCKLPVSLGRAIAIVVAAAATAATAATAAATTVVTATANSSVMTRQQKNWVHASEKATLKCPGL